MAMSRKAKDSVIRIAFLVTALSSIVALGLIMLYLFIEGLPIFEHVSVTDFLFGHFWYPTSDPPEFGIFPLIVASVAVTLVSSALAIPLGVMTAIYLAEIAGPRTRGFFKPVVELLAALPSVVIGFFGMVVVALPPGDLRPGHGLKPLQRRDHAGVHVRAHHLQRLRGRHLFRTGRAQGGLPGARGHPLGDHLRVVIPASLSGISTAIILGMSRAIGETMVVLMVAGGAAMIPNSLFSPVRPMPSSIAAEMVEAPFRGDHYYALFAIGIVLFLFHPAFQHHRRPHRREAQAGRRGHAVNPPEANRHVHPVGANKTSRNAKQRIMWGLFGASSLVNLTALLIICASCS
jgi:phosphate transport system permease protein